MARYRKKLIVIDAFQWQPVMGEVGGVLWCENIDQTEGNAFRVMTLEGPLRVSPGDWIVTGVKGERYPCKPDIFAETYEEVLRKGEDEHE